MINKIDSTHLKANANKGKLVEEQIEKFVKDYVDSKHNLLEM